MAGSGSSVHGGHRGDRDPLYPGLRWNAWLNHSWRLWEGCLMSEFPQQEDEGSAVIKKKIIRRNLVLRILVSAMDSVASVKNMEDVVVDAVLIIGMVVVVLMVAECILKMKSLKIKIMKKDMTMMKTLLHMVEDLAGVIITGVLILKIGNIIMVAVTMTTRITFLESS